MICHGLRRFHDNLGVLRGICHAVGGFCDAKLLFLRLGVETFSFFGKEISFFDDCCAIMLEVLRNKNVIYERFNFK